MQLHQLDHRAIECLTVTDLRSADFAKFPSVCAVHSTHFRALIICFEPWHILEPLFGEKKISSASALFTFSLQVAKCQSRQDFLFFKFCFDDLTLVTQKRGSETNDITYP